MGRGVLAWRTVAGDAEPEGYRRCLVYDCNKCYSIYLGFVFRKYKIYTMFYEISLENNYN